MVCLELNIWKIELNAGCPKLCCCCCCFCCVIIVVVAVVVIVQVIVFVIVVVDPRNLPLEFGQNPVINK